MSPPTHLGKYQIRRRLGQGSMGIVYEGFDPQIERVVAIKVLAPGQIDDASTSELASRFRREAQAAGRLSHPNIVAVHEYRDDVVGADGAPCAFIVMEFVPGKTLKECFDAAMQFSLPEIGRVMGELLGALAHAHEHGVVHRDIKPANVILLASGRVKVADFGVARLDASELTLTGATLGTIAFMAPEQFMGQPVDGRADVFSCGVLLYRFLTGEVPFSGSHTSTIQKLLNQEPLAPSLLNRSVSPVWDPVIRKALAKRPAERFQSAQAFAGAIRQAVSGPDDDATIVAAPSKPAGSVRSRVARIAAASAAGLVVASGLAFYLWPKEGRDGRDAVVASASAPAAVLAPAPARDSTPASSPAVAAVGGEDIEQQAWADARAADNVFAYRAFLDAYPAGRFAARARIRLAGLRPTPVPVPVTAGPAPPPVPAPRASVPDSSLAKARPSESPAPLAPKPAARASESAAPIARPAPAAPASAPPPTVSPPPETNATAKTLRDCEAIVETEVRCQVAMAAMYRDGLGVPADLAKALGWYRKAADHGNPEAQFQLGLMSIRGQGVKADPAQGLGWIRKAAEQGYTPAQNRLGNAYEDAEIGVQPNLVLASDWYAKAAAQGSPFGQANLGRMYLYGRGVFKDTGKARGLLSKSCDNGNGYGCYFLATMFEDGNGVPKDYALATRWYREALARRMITQARFNDHAKAFVAQHP
jgi:TPR repeat protein